MSAYTTVALRSVATIERNVVEASAIRNGTPYVGLENIQPGGEFVDVREVGSGELASSKFAFTKQHLLYGKLRPYLAKIARPSFEGICSTDILPVLPGPDLDRGFMAHFLLQPQMITLASSLASGANLPRLSPRALAEMKIPFPPLSEQRRIAEVLDRAEALRAKRRAALAHLDTLTQSIFQTLFGDPVTNAKGLPIVRLAEVTSRITDGVHQKPDYTETGVPFISVKDITTGRLLFDECRFISPEAHQRFTARCKPERADILYTKVGATYGRPAIIDTDREFSIYVSVCLIKPKKDLVDPVFLATALATDSVKKQADGRIKGIGVPDLHLDQIQNFRIPLPPLSDQRAFAAHVAAVEKLKSAHRASLARLDELFACLQHRAFRGEL